MDGWAFRYSILEDGSRQILDFVLPGAVLGFCSAKNGGSTYGVQALTNVTLCAIPIDSFAFLLRDMPEVGMRLARLIERFDETRTREICLKTSPRLIECGSIG